MGLILTRFWRLFTTEKSLRILMLGLDGAGKTTILYKLKLGELVTTIPTIGFNVEQVTFKSISFTIWDVGGQMRIRALWKYYFQNTQALIYVVDSSDVDRIEEAKEELHAILNDPEMSDTKLLVFANKQDLPNSLTSAQLTERLGLQAMRGRTWFIQSSNAKTAEGIFEGLAWLEQNLRD
ncbi:hypothetical protein PFISCL1PPCAC_14719 [Pristionchus fissidentatus]|uniref:ADP ribosylation factor n=1 Tax=Pristionchus fissidentatus TaxID=1538716 RepID=A0AAV5VUR8_9BILA|nr:hypothetical protein PFISCL1PPCAC_14719 [Pristionchus fissidentatus]